MINRAIAILLISLVPGMAHSGTIWRVLSKTADNKLKVKKLQDNNEYGAEYELDPLTVWGTSVPPNEPGTMVRTVGSYMWNDDENWYEWIDGSWDARLDPSLMIHASGALAQGDFISKDTKHQVYAVTEVEVIRWTSASLTFGSGSLGFSSTGTSPTISINQEPAPEARTNALGYRITGSVGSVTEFIETRQDIVSQLRQQYEDRKLRIPPRGSKWISNSSLKVIDQPEIESNFNELQRMYTNWVHETKDDNTINAKLVAKYKSRTPRKNAITPGAAAKSLHQYGYAYDITPIADKGGNAGKADDADRLITIWRDSLGLSLAKGTGYTYSASGGNKVHVQIYNYSHIEGWISD